MRLIDADALLENVKRGVYTDDLGTTIAVDICKSHIEKMSTIDAIPVEWLREQCKVFDSMARGGHHSAWIIKALIIQWQEEQEAR